MQADEPEIYFYPKHEWDIERVDTGSDDPIICSISNQLNNGYVVKLSGDYDSFRTFDIDFKEAMFQKGLIYDVQLLTPGVSSVVIPSVATEESIISSDLTNNLDFAKEISKVGVIDIKAEGKNFRLYLTGLKFKMPSYHNCTNPFGNVVIAKHDVSGDNKKSFFNSEDAEDKSLRSQAVEKEELPDVSASSSVKNNKNSGALEKGKDYAANDTVTDVTDISSVAKNSADKKTRITKENIRSPEVVRHVIRNVIPSVIDLTKNTNSTDTSMDLTDNIAKKLSKIEPTSGEPAGERTDYNNKKLLDMQNKIASLEKRIKLLSDENSVLDDELKLASKNAEDERMSISSDNWNLERATMRYNEAERQIRRMGRQLQTQRAQCELEKSDLENMLFDPKLTSQKQLAKLSSLETELEQVKSDMYRQQRQYEEKIKLLEQRLSAR